MSNCPDFFTYGYQIERELGQNRAGGRVTYLATHISTKKQVVIKQFQFAQVDSNWSTYQAYEQEIKILKQLNHPNIPQYLDDFETNSGFCLVQEYKKAQSLAATRHFSREEVKQIALALLEILNYLQKQTPPIIHRDIKPENILVTRERKLQIYLVDFGFARIGDGDVAISSVVKGTLGFMPPEQLFNRQLTESSDLYSLGIVLICLLTKTKSTEVSNLINENLQIDYRKLISYSNSKFINWLQKMVALNPKNRFPDAATALNALRLIDVSNQGKFIEKLIYQAQIQKRETFLGVGVISFLALISINSMLAAKNPSNTEIYTKIQPSQTQVTAESSTSLSSEIQKLIETRQCPGCNLRGADLTSLNLKRVDLRNADLQAAKLNGANLMDADLRGVNLNSATSTNANFKNANFEGANLIRANFQNTNLKGANFEDANLQNADLTDANLKDAEFDDANLLGTIMPNKSDADDDSQD